MLAEAFWDEVDLMADKPSRHYIYRGVPANAGGTRFYAYWAAPGMIPEPVRIGGTDRPEEFDTARQAMDRAQVVLLDALNARAQRKTSLRDKMMKSLKMNGAEFSLALAEADISPTDFAAMWGTTPERVMSWMDDEQDVPFPIRWALHLLKRPGAYDEVMSIVEANVTDTLQWTRRAKIVERFNALVNHVERHLPARADDIVLRFNAVMSEKSKLNLKDKVAALEEIAKDLGAPLPAPADSRSPTRG